MSAPAEEYIAKTSHEQRHQLAVAHATVSWRQTDRALGNLITVITIFAVTFLPMVGIWFYQSVL